MQVNNKTVIVTGGGNGIGRELVLLLLRKGARVAAVDRSESALQETIQLAGDACRNLSTHVLDITDKNALAAFPDQVIAKHGNIDALINNAGIIQPFVKVCDLDDAAIERVMNVNFYGTLNMIRVVLPHLQKRPEAHLLNLSSMGGFLPVPGQSVYGASKAAVKLLTEALYAEMLFSKVRVSIVFPGAIHTNISVNSGLENPGKKGDANQKSFKMLSPQKAAEQIIAGMEKNKVRIYVGSDSRFMNFLYRVNPGYATRLIARKMKSLLNS